MSVHFAVITFPGSNCDMDCLHVAGLVPGGRATPVWHKDGRLPDGVDCVILPGGFSYGDYLRCGAIAKFSPVVREVIAFAARGGLVIGICNGFQILTELGLLPGALMKNTSLKFICRHVSLRVENAATPFTGRYRVGEVVTVPIAHMEGNYFADPESLARLEGDGRIVFRYCDAAGTATAEANPNGAAGNIAGIVSESRNVLGMMPHPERVSEGILGGTDGFRLFESIADAVGGRK